ncbi:caspase family protein, partial [bacterium]
MPLIPLLLLAAARGTVSSVPVALRQESARADTIAEALPIAAEKKWALCVGAGAYTGGLAPLKFAPNDARAFAKTLEETYGFDPSTVDLVADAEDGKAGRPPTGANILGGLDRLLADRRLDRGDLFVFFFSGHGVGTASGDYLMPTDVPESEAVKRGIPVRNLIERFVRAGLKNVLVVADACRSGAKNPFGNELQELGRKANIAVLLGCAPGQRSYEYPRLQKGVFTHFLVRAMADRSLTDPTSGALWASAVAAKVSKQVKSYTEADYGDDPQVPAVWSEPSQDVLLAAYPPKSEETKEAFRIVSGEFKAGRLDPDRYRRYLSGLGEALRTVGRSPEAIGAFKTLDGLWLATWGDLLSLAVALNGENRDNEIGSLVARAAREPVPTDQSEFVVLLGQPSYLGVTRYRQALARVSDPKTYGFTGATLLVTVSRDRLRLSDAAVARGLAPYVPLLPKDSAEGRYVAAHIALGEKRYAEAIALSEAAEVKSSTEREELRQVRFDAAEAMKD